EVPHEGGVGLAGLAHPEPRTDRRRDLPCAAAARDARRALGAGRRQPGRAVARHPRAPGARRGGGGVSAVAPLITAERLSKWYGQVIGLNDVGVSVPPGITGLLGPNGAGK